MLTYPAPSAPSLHPQDAYQELLNAVQVKDTGDGQNLQRMQVGAYLQGLCMCNAASGRVCTHT